MHLATLDLETDPFEVGRIVQPFLSGYYDGSEFISIWDANPESLIDRTVKMLRSRPPGVVYIHNGGRFDLFYFMRHISGDLKIINGRIISCKIANQEVRDSFAIMPFPLSAYRKDDIDYTKLEADVRDLHRDEIISYLRGDVVYLHELCSTFLEEFGNKLTIGGASLSQLKKFHSFTTGGENYDSRIRYDYYYGGRNQCFQTGVIHGPIKIYDVNSMYPYVMRTFLHPIGTQIDVNNRLTEQTCFVTVEGTNRGAFPVRTKTGLDFTCPSGRFTTTVHELIAAVDVGSFSIKKVLKTYNYSEQCTFAEFIDHFFGRRLEAKAANDKARDLLFKFCNNSAYGKFSQNPENFFDYQVTPSSVILDEECFHCYGAMLCPSQCSMCRRFNNGELTEECMYCDGTGKRWFPSEQTAGYILWESRPKHAYFNNVATGASITGAARAVLLRGLAVADNPLYCDTDSIISFGHHGLPISDKELGHWKLEGEGDIIAIAGKKLYAVYSFEKPSNPKHETDKVKIGGRSAWCVKKAHKGVKLSGAQILKIAQGETIEYANPVPAYKLDGKHQWITRKVRRTSYA